MLINKCFVSRALSLTSFFSSQLCSQMQGGKGGSGKGKGGKGKRERALKVENEVRLLLYFLSLVQAAGQEENLEIPILRSRQIAFCGFMGVREAR